MHQTHSFAYNYSVRFKFVFIMQKLLTTYRILTLKILLIDKDKYNISFLSILRTILKLQMRNVVAGNFPYGV